MNNREKFTLLGWVCIIYSFIANFQLTLAIILALVIMVISFGNLTDKHIDDIDDIDDIDGALEMMNTSFDELKDVAVGVFVCVAGFIMLVVAFHKILMVI